MKDNFKDPRTPVIKCGCGHSLKLHEDQNYGLNECRHPECDCDTWEWSEGQSDGEFHPLQSR